MSGAAIEVADLVKRYGTTTALDRLTFEAGRGQVTALLGPNGAGKTTTVEICEGFRRADDGVVRVLGHDPVRQAAELKPKIGVMLQSGGVPHAARAVEMLRLFASFHAHPLDPMMLLDRLGLRESTRIPYRRLSGGQQQRLSLAMALVGRPELVFLDEPTSGLDPQARRETWHIVDELRASGATVVLTTHHMEEAEQLADHVVIVDGGRVVGSGSPSELTSRDGSQLRFRAAPGLDLANLEATLPQRTVARETTRGHYLIEGDVDSQLLAAVTGWCASHQVLATDVRVEQRTLEDVFLELTGRELRG